MKKLNLLLLLLLTVPAAYAKTKNLIFIVADGMGLASIAGTRIYYQGAKGSLNIERFKTIGLSKTYSTDNFTTDSAAGATAFATTKKSYNGAISVDKDQNKLKTIFDVAIKNKKKVGIVTTTSVTHATPACFYAHAKLRSQERLIATQVKTSNLSFLLGGGSKYFSKDEIKKLNGSNWNTITRKSGLQLVNKTDKSVLGIFSLEHLNYSIKNKNHPELVDMVKVGLKRLQKNPEGYMFLIEAGRIDHASHENKAKEHFGEVKALDDTINYLLKNVNLKETLIILTSDHETAGLAINGYGDIHKVKGDYFLNSKSSYGDNPFISWATGPASKTHKNHKSTYYTNVANHTAIDVPIYSIGKGHNSMGGFMKNNEITLKVLKLMGLTI